MKKFNPNLAIGVLHQARDVAKNNEKYNRQHDPKQAALERDTSQSIDGSVKALSQHQAILDTLKKMKYKENS